jgi:hypothetical protein
MVSLAPSFSHYALLVSLTHDIGTFVVSNMDTTAVIAIKVAHHTALLSFKDSEESDVP